jgi:glyoxylase-like metal-dependent hydrolase (beta-lactamase superfamily II)
MLRLYLPAIVLLASIATAATVSAEIATLTRLAPNVMVVRDSAYNANMTVVRTTAGLVVIDGFMHRASTRDGLDRAADSLGERRIALAFNTHGHDDHAWGNQVIRERGAPQIVAHDSTTAYVRARIPQMAQFFHRGPIAVRAAQDSLVSGDSLSEATRTRLRNRIARVGGNLAAHADLTITPPTLSIHRDTSITVGRTRILVHSVGAAHSVGDLVIVIPSEHLMAVGDLALTEEETRPDEPDRDLANWIGWMERIAREGRAEKIQHVVPGHGRLGTPELLTRTRDHLQALNRPDSTGTR